MFQECWSLPQLPLLELPYMPSLRTSSIKLSKSLIMQFRESPFSLRITSHYLNVWLYLFTCWAVLLFLLFCCFLVFCIYDLWQCFLWKQYYHLENLDELWGCNILLTDTSHQVPLTFRVKLPHKVSLPYVTLTDSRFTAVTCGLFLLFKIQWTPMWL